MAGNYIAATEKDFTNLVDKGVPREVARGLLDYVNDGAEPDKFLWAVLTNDLSEACAWAPEVGAWFKPLLTWIYSYVPSNAWRTNEKVRMWCNRGGANGT